MAATPKDVRALELDATDRELLRVLQLDARIPNSELAARVGIAASTAHGRVRRLVDAGVIRGFFADVDPAAVGRPLRAMVAVSLQSDARGQIRRFVGEIARRDEVIASRVPMITCSTLPPPTPRRCGPSSRCSMRGARSRERQPPWCSTINAAMRRSTEPWGMRCDRSGRLRLAH